ncbi:MAG: nuclear transport factor 2 family protein [Candidatus Dormibacterales bacterium]
MQEDPRAMINRLLDGIDGGDTSVMNAIFAADAVIEWPASGEQIVGADDRRAVYAHTPILPKITNRHIYGSGDLWVAEATMTYGPKPYLACLVFRFKDGRIARQVGYWSEPSTAPEWRAQWVKPLDPAHRS